MSSDAQPGPTRSVGASEVVADRVAAAVLEVSGVHALHGGVLGEVATYLPGRQVAGIRLREPSSEPSEVHIVLEWDSAALATADAVRARVEQIVAGPVHVVIEDVTEPEAPTLSTKQKEL